VAPADERLDAGDGAVLDVHLGLVVQFELALVDRAAQGAEQAEPVGAVGVPLGGVGLHP